MTVRGVLLDIEGTTSSISFVYDVMFPFVRRELVNFLAREWQQPELQRCRDQLARDSGHASFAAWANVAQAATTAQQQSLAVNEVIRLMDADVKSTGLKQLQGMIWKSGFDSGELQAHVYSDVPTALETWRLQGLDVRIYSSGSVDAQRLFFGHTIAGDLLPLLQGHYDTVTGPKREADSYRQIANAFGIASEQILFVSDVVGELDAARAAGMQTALAIRTGNSPVSVDHGHREITSFAQLSL